MSENRVPENEAPENHDAIVVDAKLDEAGAAARSRTAAPPTRPRAAATTSGGRTG